MNKADRILLQEFAAQFRTCAVCWWPERDMRRRMEIHHLVGGPGRKHDRRNLLSLCSACHGVLHSGKVFANKPDLTHAMLLTAKQETDPEFFDPEFLASLRNKKHLGYDPEPIPAYYLEERVRNDRWDSRTP